MRVAVMGLVCAGCLFAQANTGSILGTATDSSGAVVPQVKVLLINVKTGLQSSVITNSVGDYVFEFLPPGDYRMEAEVPGFKKFVRENITLDVTRQLRINIALEAGQVTETVSVTARASLVETETGSLSTTVENQQVTSLPLLGRDPQALRLLAPGVVNTGNGPITQGGLVRKDPYYIDGVNSSFHVWSGNPVNPNPDVIAEFKTLTNSFSAEYGESSGAVMISTTKSGTNDMHGTVFEFWRNDALNAGNYFAHKVANLRRNQFGGTMGGPIRKNKTFFFFDMQYTTQTGAAAFTNITVPLPEFRQGDFSRISNVIYDPQTTQTTVDSTGKSVVVRSPFAGNLIPTARINPASLKVQALFPAPLVNTPFANFSAFGANTSTNLEYDVKVDHSFSDKDKMTVRWSAHRSTSNQPAAFGTTAGGPLPGTLGPGYLKNPGRQAVVNWVHLFGSRATNNLNIGWFDQYPKRTTPGYGKLSENDLGIFGMPNGGDKLGTPYFLFTNFEQLGATTDTLFFELQNNNNLTDVASVVLGRHTLKFGGEARHLRTDNLQPGPMNTSWSFNSFFTDQRGVAGTGFDYAGFLLGLPASMNYSIYPDYFRSRTSVYALFAQDDLRLSRKLTLNVGLRWDAPLWYHEAQNRSGVFDLNAGMYQRFGQNGFRDTPWNNNWLNFGPRIGFAWSPLDHRRLVLRGGFGLFSVGTNSAGANGFMITSPIFADADVGRYTTTDQINWKTMLDTIPYVPADKTGKNAISVSVFPDHNPMSHFEQYNFNVENEFKSILVEVGYAGSRGAHLQYGAYNLNAVPVALAPSAQGRFIAPFVRYPQYPNGVTSQSWIGSSDYNSLQIKVERRFTSGLGLVGAYTFAKLIDTGQLGYRDPLVNRRLDRGLAPDNAPQRFTLAFNYRLPFGKGNHWVTRGPLAYVIGGWELNGITTFQSGDSITPGISANTCVCGNNFAVPNVSTNPRLDPSQRTLAHWFDTKAFSVPAPYTIGNAGRGLIYGPHLFNQDLAGVKRFPLPFREGMDVELRAEFYNALNTPQFNDPNVTLGAGTFGQITGSKGAERQGQLALKMHW
jgi:hypothetical protein